MSNHEPERMPERDVADEDLPEELQPTDENPLAKPLTDDPAGGDPKPAEELDMEGGKEPEHREDDDSGE